MRLRPLDAADRRAYLQELRPRMFVLGIRAGRIDLRWWVPAWAIEEPLRFFLRTAPLARHLAPMVLRRWPELARRVPAAVATAAEARALRSWWDEVDAWFSEAHRDLLSIPDGSPLLEIATPAARVVVRETRL